MYIVGLGSRNLLEPLVPLLHSSLQLFDLTTQFSKSDFKLMSN